MDTFQQTIRDERGRFLEALDGDTTAERAADLGRQLMVRRTRAGLDRHGEPFAPYSPRTGKTGIVDLTETRAMLDDFVVEPEQTASTSRGLSRAVVAPGSARSRRLTRLHTRTGTPRAKLPLRDFAGLTPRQLALVGSQMGTDVRAAVRGSRRGRRIAVVVGTSS